MGTRFALRETAHGRSATLDAVGEGRCVLPTAWLTRVKRALPDELLRVACASDDAIQATDADASLWAAMWWAWMRTWVPEPDADLQVWSTCSVGCSSRGFERMEHIDDSDVLNMARLAHDDRPAAVLVLHARGRGPRKSHRADVATHLQGTEVLYRGVSTPDDIAQAVVDAIVAMQPSLEPDLAPLQGWPLPAVRFQPSTDLKRWLISAQQLAMMYRHGFVGLEHLALTAGDQRWTESSPPAQLALQQLTATLESSLAGLEGKAAHMPRATPRMRRWMAQLHGECSAVDLWRVLANDPHHHLHELLDSDLTIGSDTPSNHAPPCLSDSWALQVVGGPEDGRVLAMREGTVVGRGKQDTVCHHALYANTQVVDPFLSRRALYWFEAGSAEVAGSIVRRRRGYRDGRFGRITVLPGDLLVLTNSTRVRAIGPAPPATRWGD